MRFVCDVTSASHLTCFFDPFPLLYDYFVTSRVDIRRSDVVQALVITLVAVVIHEGFYMSFKITGQEVVFKQDAVFGFIPTKFLPDRRP